MAYYFTEPFFSFSDIHRLMEDTLSSIPAIESGARGRERGEERGLTTARQWQPRMDVHEDSEKNFVSAVVELPGLRKEDVNVEVQGNRLIISGEMSQRKEVSDKDYVLKERRYGRFSRALPVPSGLKPGDVKASMENGVLNVTFPKRTQEQMPQRITVA